MERLKRGLSAGFLSVLFINLVSAQFYGNIGQFSFSNFLSSINPQDLTLMALFIIFFAVLFYAFGKFFKDSYGQPNKAIAGAVAFGVAALITYYGFYRTGFDLTGLFYGWGIDEGLLYSVIPILLLAFVVIGLWKRWFSFAGLFALLGFFLILLVMFTDIFYEEFFVGLVGFVLLLIGLWMLWRKHKKKLNPLNPPGIPPGSNPQQQIIYQQRKRSVYDLQQKYHSYALTIFRINLDPSYRRHMLKAMYMIRDYLRKLGASHPGQSPEQLEKTLRKKKLI